jgi:diguanylate cyclase (GGDEF)-like protein/PAS domain S-box-containing protein
MRHGGAAATAAKWRRSLRTDLGSWQLGACVLLTIGLWGVVGRMLFDERRQSLAAAEQTAANLRTELLQQIDRTFEGYDLSLQAAISGMRLPGFAALLPQILLDGPTTATDLAGIGIVAADGRVTIATGIDGPPGMIVADRDFFTVHRDNPNLGMYVSRPFLRRHAPSMEIALSRRIDGPDGQFAGVVFGLIDIDYFRHLFEGLSLGPLDIIALYRGDLQLLMRHPFNAGLLGSISGPPPAILRQQPSGTFRQVSVVDGVPRLYSFQRGTSTDLIVTVGLAQREIYRVWWRRVAVVVPITLVLGLVAMALAVQANREMRRRRQAEHAARQNEEMYRSLAEHSGDLIIRTDLDGIRRYLSPSVAKTLGWRPEELVGTTMAKLVHPDDQASVQKMLDDARAGLEPTLLTYRVRRHDGEYIWVETHIRLMRDSAGQPVAFISNMREVTSRKLREDALWTTTRELEILATTDPLTGLANRRRLDQELEREWLRARRDRRPIALMLIDADHFKSFNDSYGHPQGDHVLRTIADCIDASFRRPGDIAARYGGEEFAVVLPNATTSQAVHVAENIRRAVLARAIPHAGNPAGVATVSIGVAAGNAGPPLTPPVLMHEADAALYTAKQQGRNCVHQAAERFTTATTAD